MTRKHLAIFGAVALSLTSITTLVYAFGEPVKGVGMTMEQAKKKYPEPKGGYPTASFGSSGSVIVPSPYNSSRMVDASDCKRGMPCLDPLANKVFLKP